MSTILEALKKSEAERARLEGDAALEPAPEPRGGLRLLPVLALLGILVVALWFGIGRDDPGPPAGEPTLRSTDAAGTLDPASKESPAVARNPQPLDGGGEATSMPRPGALSRPVPTALDGPPMASAPVQNMRPPDAAADEIATSEPGVLDVSQAASDAAAALAANPPVISDVSAVATQQTLPVERPSQEPAPPALVDLAEEQPVRRAEERTPRPAAATASLPSIHALPPGAARTQFETLKLNMHVFADEPSERFVLINLRRYTEGADLGGGLEIARIQPEGVVIRAAGNEWNWAPR